MSDRRSLAFGLLVLVSGCTLFGVNHGPETRHRLALGDVHPIQDPAPRILQLCACVPQAEKDRTHLFFVNGVDPLYAANLPGLAQEIQGLGFRHCACGQMIHAGHFGRTIRKLRKADGTARVVLVGFSAGANSVCGLARELERDAGPIDLLVYIGGDTLRNVPASRPANADRVLNITGHGCALLGGDLVCNGAEIDGAMNHRLDCRHMLLPSHARTGELLLQHLVAICQGPPSG